MEYSIVIPLYNEEPNISPLLEEVEMTMSLLGKKWELLAINDGSTDDTEPLLDELAITKPFLRPIHFTTNCGQSSAFDAGFRLAQGSVIITLDGDRQNNPQDIPRLLQELDGFDMVCGIRQDRKDRLFKRWISKIANAVRQRICKDGVQDTGCSLKVYRKQCLTHIKMFDGMHRFLPALFLHEGFRIKEIPVSHRPRTAGKSKYHLFNRSFNTVADLFAVRWMAKRKLHYHIREK